MAEGSCSGVEQVDAAKLCSNPEAPAAVLEDETGGVVTQTGGILGVVLMAREVLRRSVEGSKATTRCRDPEHALRVFGDRGDGVIRKRLRIVGRMTISSEIVSVIPIQTVLGSKPQESAVVLKHAADAALGEAASQTYAFKDDGDRRGRQTGERGQDGKKAGSQASAPEGQTLSVTLQGCARIPRSPASPDSQPSVSNELDERVVLVPQEDQSWTPWAPTNVWT